MSDPISFTEHKRGMAERALRAALEDPDLAWWEALNIIAQWEAACFKHRKEAAE